MQKLSKYIDFRTEFIQCLDMNKIKNNSYILSDYYGFDNEKLYTDVGFIGNENADRIIVVVSGTHGVEGYCGSMCQSHFLKKLSEFAINKNIGVLLIHGLNPYGFSWNSRTDHNNIDVNRNFVDFEDHKDVNVLYRELHDLIFSSNVQFEKYKIRENLGFFVAKYGKDQLVKTIYSGQYSCESGIFFGGKNESWSRLTIQDIYDKYCGNKKLIVVYDIHTGLGDYGQLSPIYTFSNYVESLNIAETIFEDRMIKWKNGDKNFSSFEGKMMAGLSKAYPKFKLVNITLEFGTYAKERMLEAIIIDGYLRQKGVHDLSEHDIDYLTYVQGSFFPHDLGWQQNILTQFMSVMYKTIDFLCKI